MGVKTDIFKKCTLKCKSAGPKTNLFLGRTDLFLGPQNSPWWWNYAECGGARIMTPMDCIAVPHASVGLSGRLAYASLPDKNSTRRGITGGSGTHGRLGMSQPWEPKHSYATTRHAHDAPAVAKVRTLVTIYKQNLPRAHLLLPVRPPAQTRTSWQSRWTTQRSVSLSTHYNNTCATTSCRRAHQPGWTQRPRARSVRTCTSPTSK